ncbi:uncharacterized protein [Anser cygnoides]|uniref:uncharacterized protein n=1 Tax=Anser cygnoides TaxID=8845 RepID=UPI0034D1E491
MRAITRTLPSLVRSTDYCPLVVFQTGAGVTTQGICSSPGFREHGGNDQAPVLFLNTSSAQEGETVWIKCTIDGQFPAQRVFFCKNGQEEFSLRAQHGKVIYALVLNVTSRSAGTYTCGYQQRNESNWVRSSALSAPRTLSVPGSSAGETTQDKTSSAAPHARLPHALPTGTALAVAAVGLVLLAAGSWFAIRKGACRGRCPRQQHVDSPQMENTDSGEVQCEYCLLPRGKPQAASAHGHPMHLYMQSHHFISHWDIQNPCPFIKARFLSSTSHSTIAHIRRDRPPPVQQMSDTTTYATVTRTQTR